MNHSTADKIWRTVIGSLFLGLLLYSLYAIKTVYAYHQVQEQQSPATPEPPFYGPRIPMCDKELWLRIKDGCK